MRYYDPSIGRWIAPDPLSFADGPNLYAYLHHNPLMNCDPYGLSCEAYRESCQLALNSPNFHVSNSPDRSESNQYGNQSSYIHNASAGAVHGCIDYGGDSVIQT